VTDALRFLALAELIGLAAAPLAGVALSRLPGAGLGLAKPLGVLLVTWLVWLGASLHVVPYGTGSAVAAIALVAVAGLLAARRVRRRPDPLRRRLFVASELVFLVAFGAMALLVAYSPDVWSTEKPMDMAFLNAVNQSRYFPPHDPWLAGADLNYYYLGHLACAIVVRLADVDPARGYNLAVALVFALAASAVFTLAATLWGALRRERPQLRRGAVAVGLAAVAACLVLGNLAGARELVQDGGYDWFAPSRVVPGTITEFPWFSFLLADLHAHVLAIPFTMLALAFVAQVALAGPPGPRAVAETAAAALAIGALYAINSWSYPVAAGLLAAACLPSWRRGPAALAWSALVLALGALLVLPFHLAFDPAAEGLGLVGERRGLGAFAGDQALVHGLFVALLAPVLAGRLGRGRGARPLWLLLAGGLICIALAEVVYVRDAFEGGPLERMNTVFKLGYQAWLLLAVAGTVAAFAAAARLSRRALAVWALVLVPVLAAAAVYPLAGTYARKDGFARAPTLDGLRWLARSAPGDVAAIAWLRSHAPGDAVVLEAVGDDYSPRGHARIATFTGLATVLGWPGHELQWDHDPGRRRDAVARAYRTPDAAVARALLARYRVRYVVVGPLERADHGEAGVPKWDRLGRRVLQRGGTVVWDVASGRT
jgi:uncharacterized membrane protein